MVAAMVTMAGCHRSLIQPYLWLVATYLPPKGSRRFYGRDLVGQPARASCQPQPAADSRACRRSQPADTSQASQPVITPYNYHTIVLNHTKMFKWKRPIASVSLTKRAEIYLTPERIEQPPSWLLTRRHYRLYHCVIGSLSLHLY